MGDQPPNTLELTCPGCSAYFRLKPKKGRLPKGPIECPKCGTPIPIPTNEAAPPADAPKAQILGRRRRSETPRATPAQARDVSDAPKLGDTSGSPRIGSPSNPNDSGTPKLGSAIDALFNDDSFSEKSGGVGQTFMGFPQLNKAGSDNEQRPSAPKSPFAPEPTMAVPKDQIDQLRASHAEGPSPDDERENTDTSLFGNAQRSTREIPAVDPGQAQMASEREDVLRRETPMQLEKLEFGDADPVIPEQSDDEPGPFDLRDILEAERESISPEMEGSVTRNPALEKGKPYEPLTQPEADEPKPLPSMEGFDMSAARVPTRPQQKTVNAGGAEERVNPFTAADLGFDEPSSLEAPSAGIISRPQPAEPKPIEESGDPLSEDLPAFSIPSASKKEADTFEIPETFGDFEEPASRPSQKDQTAEFEFDPNDPALDSDLFDDIAREPEPEEEPVAEPEPEPEEGPAPKAKSLKGLLAKRFGKDKVNALREKLEEEDDPSHDDRPQDALLSEFDEGLEEALSESELSAPNIDVPPALAAAFDEPEPPSEPDAFELPEQPEQLDERSDATRALDDLLGEEDLDDAFGTDADAPEPSRAPPLPSAGSASRAVTREVPKPARAPEHPGGDIHEIKTPGPMAPPALPESTGEVAVERERLNIEEVHSDHAPTTPNVEVPPDVLAAASSAEDEDEQAGTPTPARPAPLGSIGHPGLSLGGAKPRVARGKKTLVGLGEKLRAITSDSLPTLPEHRAIDALGAEESASYEDLRRGRGAGRRRRASESQSGVFALDDVEGQEQTDDGQAGERRGSGFIRLPTQEILDVLGEGTYRLMVEDIVYEPVDEKGLTELIKRGVFMGAERIADQNGPWQPIGEHPVFKRLRRKMAMEAHSLLAERFPEVSSSRSSENADASSSAQQPPPREPSRHEQPTRDASTELERPESLGLHLGEQNSEPQNTLSTPLPEPMDTGNLDAPVFPEPALDDGFDDFDDFDDFDAPLEDDSYDESDPEVEPELDLEDDSEPEDEPEVHALQEDPATHDPAPTPEERAPLIPEPVVQTPPETAQEPEPEQTTPLRDSTLDVDDPLLPPTSSRMPMMLIALVVGLLGLGLVGYGGYTFFFSGDDTDSSGEIAGADGTDPTGEPADADSLTGAIDAARASLGEATTVDTSDRATRTEAANALLAEGRPARAATIFAALWSETPKDVALTGSYAKSLIDSGQVVAGRAIALHGTTLEKNQTYFREMFVQSLESDPELQSGTRELEAGDGFDAMKGAGDTEELTFVLTKGGQPAFGFKPIQGGWEEGWRNEVAAWRLCRIIGCSFAMPKAELARITRTQWNSIAKGVPDANSSDLSWINEEGTDEPVLYGVLKEWTPAGPDFPIVQRTSDWRALVDAKAPKSLLEKPLPDMLKSHLRRPELAAAAGDGTSRDVARQLSDMAVYDFLVNDWERYRERPAFNGGATTQFIDGEVTSANNSWAFAPRASGRVKGRFNAVSRFSKTTTRALREVSPELIDSMLYPDPGPGVGEGNVERRLEVFWAQRKRALARIDKLTSDRGSKDILEFD